MTELCVKINENEKSYPIFIDADEISILREKILSYTRGKKVVVVISEKVEKLYGKLLGFEKHEKFILKDGEKEKNFVNYQKIIDFALKNKLSRKDAIIAIGGGVVGDMAGFAAASYMRGIDFIQVPTTLLACVDSSVGGKVGINTKYGKNLVGAFYQPKAVIINLNFLKSLDMKQLKTGLGEVVKYSFIEKSCLADNEFNLTNILNDNFDKILNLDLKTMKEIILACITLKISVVQKDEKEGNLRRILNFGHTYGHAVEKITNYKKYTHGEAVVKGMLFAFDLAVKKGLIDKNYDFFAKDLIKKFNFQEIPDYDLAKMIELMKTDKKSFDGSVTFILPTDYSRVQPFEYTPEQLL